jgi:hypothetical protein
MYEHFSKILFPIIHQRQQQFLGSDGVLPRACVFLDGHATRRLINLWKEALALGIDIHIFPAHTSHLIQPLDRCVFASLKKCVVMCGVLMDL